jgi:hypothetical protein
MAERETERDSLLDLDDLDLALSDDNEKIDVLDDSSPTLPPDKFPHRLGRQAISTIEAGHPDTLMIVDPAIPVELIDAHQAETTKPIRKFRIEDLSDPGIPKEPMVIRISELSIDALMQEPGERIALLLAKI